MSGLVLNRLIYASLAATAFEESELEKRAKLEAELLRNVTAKQSLMGVQELAKGVQYTEALQTRYVVVVLPSDKPCA